MKNVMIYDNKIEKKKFKEEFYITINVFLSDKQINIM